MSIFNKKEELIKERKLAFDRVFKSKDGETILYVLGEHCLPEIGKYEPDPYKMAFKEGQRNMLFRIANLANIEIQELLKANEKRKEREQEWME